MKPERGPNPGAAPRTLRGRALDVGTSPSGFPDNADGPYDASAGVPVEVAGGTYKSNVPEGGATPAAPLPDPNPFKLGPQ